MHIISLDRKSPNAFVLVSDGEFSKEKPIEDQVWAVNLKSTDPHPFYMSTTYGLRAKSVRLFPNFILDNQRISKPEDFSLLPRVINYSPSSIQIEAEYQNRVSFLFTFFLPEPDILTGQLQINNSTKTAEDVTFQLAFNLAPLGKGQRSHPEKSGTNQFITGRASHLEPVLFMTGGPTAINNPFPALSIQLSILPHGSQDLSWVLASKETQSESYEKAKRIITSGWQEAFQNQIMHHLGQIIDIKTGEQDWDSAFFLSQVNASTHFLAFKHEAGDSHFIKVRLPDESSITDQREITPSPLTNLELNHLCQVILPAKTNLFMKLLRKQIKSQSEKSGDGFKETHFGPLMNLKGCPLLASILLEIFEITGNQEILEELFPDLNLIYKSWLKDPLSGSDRESFHWESPSQLQLDTGLFSFDVWETYSKGLDINKTESPSLYAMLVKEAKALKNIAKILGDRSHQHFYKKWEQIFQKKLESCWNEETNSYGYKDLDSRLGSSGQVLYKGHPLNNIQLNQTFTEPKRLLCHIFTIDERTRACTIKINGKSPQGDPQEEIFRSPGILWVPGHAHMTSEYLYREVKTISFEGLDPEDQFIIETADYCQIDISCLLPLWANVGNKEHFQKLAQQFLGSHTSTYQYGIPETWECQYTLPEDMPLKINVLWNTLILEGLINQGETEKLTTVFKNLMSAIIQGLKDYDGFFPLFDNDSGKPIGQVNAITGLVPIRLFLKIAGIKLISPAKVAVWGKNPFPWPIEINWQGLSLWKENQHTKISFPTGAMAEHHSEKPVLISSN